MYCVAANWRQLQRVAMHKAGDKCIEGNSSLEDSLKVSTVITKGEFALITVAKPGWSEAQICRFGS